MLKIFIIFLFSFNAAFGLYLQEKFQHARPGDYIVTAHDNTYSLLVVHSLTTDVLVLEEIAVPAQQIHLKTVQWHTWLNQNAPGHTSWTLYEIDLKRGELIECFSRSKNGWVYFDAQEQFFAKLFALPFAVVSGAERKKIGPQPGVGEVDHRKPWNPPLVIEGKKIAHPHFDVLQTRWPKDRSPLSQCTIELYFNAEHTSFPFPYWIEAQSPHYAFRMRVIASGHELLSPTPAGIPHRLPEFVGPAQKNNSSWTIALRVPFYLTDLQLTAFDLTAKKSLLIPHHLERQQERVTLHVKIADLNQLLEIDHRYQWIISSNTAPSVRSEEIFSWKSYQQ